MRVSDNRELGNTLFIELETFLSFLPSTYRVRQSFPEPSGFQYPERTIASTETNDTSAKSP